MFAAKFTPELNAPGFFLPAEFQHIIFANTKRKEEKIWVKIVTYQMRMQDALQFFVENRMTIEASALLQKMKEKGIKPYDENFKL